MKQTIIIHELPPLLNKWQRMHHQKRHAIKKDWVWRILAEKPAKHTGRVTIRFTRFSTRCGDPDNIAASFKCIGDGLVKAGVIEDDSFEVIKEFTAAWKKVSKRKFQRVQIEIEDV